MVGTVILLGLWLPNLVTSSGEGNLHLLQDEVGIAMRSCIPPSVINKGSTRRQQRSPLYVHTNIKGYSQEKRNMSDLGDQIHVLNATDYDYDSPEVNNGGHERLVNNRPSWTIINRTRRGDPLLTKPDSDLCLSQCIFANLQVVDTRGIPRETELWAKIQSSVASQQSRAMLKEQMQACFQELQSDAEDDGCSYSNKLEKCLTLRFSDRKENLIRKSQKNT